MRTIDQPQIVSKVLKAFPSGTKITQEHLNKVIELVDSVLAHNNAKSGPISVCVVKEAPKE